MLVSCMVDDRSQTWRFELLGSLSNMLGNLWELARSLSTAYNHSRSWSRLIYTVGHAKYHPIKWMMNDERYIYIRYISDNHACQPCASFCLFDRSGAQKSQNLRGSHIKKIDHLRWHQWFDTKNVDDTERSLFSWLESMFPDYPRFTEWNSSH